MRIVAEVLARPSVTVAVLTIIGLTALVLQVIFEWFPAFARSELLFLLFACMGVDAGSAVSSRVLPRLHRLEEHLGGSTGGTGSSDLPQEIGKKY